MTKRTLFSIHFQILSKMIRLNWLKYNVITAFLASNFDHYAPKYNYTEQATEVVCSIYALMDFKLYY